MSAGHLTRIRLAAARAFLQADAAGHLGDLWAFGAGAMRDAALAVALDFLLVFTYCSYLMP